MCKVTAKYRQYIHSFDNIFTDEYDRFAHVHSFDHTGELVHLIKDKHTMELTRIEKCVPHYRYLVTQLNNEFRDYTWELINYLDVKGKV